MQERTGSLLRRIHEVYGDLPGQERRAADAILRRPFEMAVWTASELAETAGVSNATISRFVQRLGFRNFEAARQDARALRETGAPLFMRDPQVDGEGLFIGLARAEAKVIEATLSRLDPAALRAAAAAAAGARRVRVLGFRNSRFLADYICAQLAQLRPDVAPLAQDGQTIADGLAGLGAGDVAILIGLRRRAGAFARIAELATQSGARVALLADRSLRDDPALATWRFDCVVETDWPRDSYSGALALLRLLAIECAGALGDAGRRHLDAIEALREDLDELEPISPSAPAGGDRGRG